MRLKPDFRYIFFLVLFFCLFLFSIPADVFSADIGNCLLCHKYPGLSRIDEEGKLRLLFVNESIFNNSVHAKVKCGDCHTDIKKIPHEPAKKVDCLTECHIIEPASEKKFSHKDVKTFLEKSVHGKIDIAGKSKKYVKDLPTCKSCHDNPLYRPLSFYKMVRPGISEAAMGRCRVCHKTDDFIFRFYNHITTRLHKIRSPKNIAEMCGRCHNDPNIAARHQLPTQVVSAYGETFHGKAASFLSERVPDCLDCHVRLGESVHQMLSHENQFSPTYENNKSTICSRLECHPKASPKLASYKVHPVFDRQQSPKQFYFRTFFIILTGGTLLPLMGIMFLELTRRLFPNLTFNRKGKSDGKPDDQD